MGGSGKETFPVFQFEGMDPPSGRSLYVINAVTQRALIDEQKLVIVYRGKFSDVVVAVKP
jgi:hypothetical protein